MAGRDFRHTAGRPRCPYNSGVHAERGLNAAGYATWIVTGVPAMVDIAAGRLSGAPAMVWAAAFVAFGLCFSACIRPLGPTAAPRRMRLAMLLLQTAAGLAMVWTSGNNVAGATLVIVAGQVPHVVAPVVAWVWVGVQSGALTVILLDQFDSWLATASAGIAYAGFQLFALATAALVRRERAMRQDLAAAHEELMATRARLAESSRAEERLRIARDLHDTIGHHLTALSLQLDVASRVPEGRAAGHVLEAHAITKLLLSDVRDVVTRLRDRATVDLPQALRALTAPAGGPVIEVRVDDGLHADDAERATVLLRCAQEIVTNATRHAAARHLWIEVTRTAGGVELHARDDGDGTATVRCGNGLTGMRERFEAYGGRVTFHSAPGRGFEVRGVLPLTEPAA